MTARFLQYFQNKKESHRRFAAFSLLEMMVAMTISMVIVTVAAQSVSMLNKVMNRATKDAEADAEAKILTDVLVGEIQGAGGNAVRPTFAVGFEANTSAACVARGDLPICDGHDRLTLVQLHPFADEGGVPVTTVTHMGPSGTYDVASTCGLGGTTCCLAEDADGNGVDYSHYSVYLVSTDQQTYMPVYNTTIDTGLCQATYVTADANVLTSLTSGVPLSGTMTPIIVNTYFLDDKGWLRVWTDFDLDGSFTTTNPAGPSRPCTDTDCDVSIVMGQVIDVQYTLGYDTDNDGIITDDGTASDEWRGNHSSDESVSWDGDDIRMVTTGVAVGVKSNWAHDEDVTIWDGVTNNVSLRAVRSTKGRALLRNLDIWY